MCRIILNLETVEKKRSFEQQTNYTAANWESELENVLLSYWIKKKEERRTLKQKQVERKSNEIRTYASIY